MTSPNRPAVEKVLMFFIWNPLLIKIGTQNASIRKLSALCQETNQYLAVLLPELAQPTALFLARHLVDLASVQPDAVASRALIDLNLLKASRFQRLTALRAPHMARVLYRLFGFDFPLRLCLDELFSFLLHEIFLLLRFFSPIPLVRHC